MFLNAIVITTREVIESAMVACLLIALVRIRSLSGKTILVGLALGAIFATLYGSSIESITPWWDYRGQELVIVIVNCTMVVLILALLFAGIDTHPQRPRRIAVLITLLTSLSLTLEISEIGIYIGAYRNKPDLLTSAVTGCLIGACIGMSLAVLGYYTLIRLSTTTSLRVIRCLFALLAGGLLSQSIQLLSQVDLVSGQTPLWDSSALLSETSIFGQFMVAVLRYEARPSWLQVAFYSAGLALATWFLLNRRRPINV